eukprot:8037894-Lingulodinium_polyedra.AAC.1
MPVIKIRSSEPPALPDPAFWRVSATLRGRLYLAVDNAHAPTAVIVPMDPTTAPLVKPSLSFGTPPEGNENHSGTPPEGNDCLV